MKTTAASNHAGKISQGALEDWRKMICFLGRETVDAMMTSTSESEVRSRRAEIAEAGRISTRQL
jgi:hypothetical protein